MQVTETAASTGLRREFKVVIGKTDLDTRLNSRLERMKGQARIKGFRPGKVPVAHLRKTFGKSLMGEIIEEVVSEGSQAAITQHSLRPAQQPRIEFEGEVEQVVEGKADLEFKIAVELMPEFTPVDPATLELDRYVADVDEKDIEAQINRLAEQQRTYSPREDSDAAQSGDALTIDFIGRIDGEAFEGGSGEGVQLAIGSKRFIPGFEEQLIGAKAGEQKVVNVTFPEDYPAKNLAGKAANFDVTVKTVSAPDEVKINDDFAAKLGLASLEDLRNRVKEQIESDYKRAARAHMKRQLLDKLDAAHTFPLPEGMVEQEFNAVWQAVTGELKREGKTFADEGKSEDELKKEYRTISERRVRLGLVLAEVGRLNTLSVSQEEMTRAVSARARQFPGQEKKVFEFYQKNPQAQAEIRAPIFEDKVVDFIFELAKTKDVNISQEDLFTDPDDLIEKRKKSA